MSKDFKASVQQAIANYVNKIAEENRPKTEFRKPNQKPERDVQYACQAWLKQAGFDGQVFESKSQLVNGRWQNAGMKYGTADWGGVDPSGYAVFVEFKALGKRSTFWKVGNERQQDFILSKIEKNAFAVVVDSAEMLASAYATWLKARDQSLAVARLYLKDHLPKKPKREVDEGDLFE